MGMIIAALVVVLAAVAIGYFWYRAQKAFNSGPGGSGSGGSGLGPDPKPPKPPGDGLSGDAFPSWFRTYETTSDDQYINTCNGHHKHKKTTSWNLQNHPYFTGSLPYAQCRSRCAGNTKCKTMAGFRTYPGKETASCQFWDTVVPPGDIEKFGKTSTWEATVNFRT